MTALPGAPVGTTAHIDNGHPGFQKQGVTTRSAAQQRQWMAVRRAVWVVVAAAVGVLSQACSGAGDGCVANDECAQGQLCRGGACVSVEDTGNDAGTSADAGHVTQHDAGVTESDASVPDTATAPDAGRPGGPCPFNDDGVLTSEELPLGLNVESRFIASGLDASVPIDLAGTDDGQGNITWDLSGALTGDHPVTITAVPLDGLWFGPDFLDGEYAAPLDGTGETYGVFKRTESAILLLGVASAERDHTLLTHDPPVTVVEFPLRLNQHFSTETQTSGTFEGNPFYLSNDTYEMDVDARGTVRTPAGDFPSLRIRIQQTVSVVIAVFPFYLDYTYIRYSFMSACYSQVAHVASKEGEENLLFTEAAEVRRLGLPQ